MRRGPQPSRIWLAGWVILVTVLVMSAACGERAGGAPGAVAPASAEPFIRVLGTAQDGGFPHAACSCSRCRLARQRQGHERLVASLAIVAPASDRVYLVDATPDIRRQIDRLEDVRRPPGDRVDRSPVDGIFLTHGHIGHYLGLAFLGFEAVHTRKLPVYGSGSMLAFLRSNGPWDQLVELGNIEPIEVRPSVAVELPDGVRAEAFPVPHRDEYTDTVGYLVSGPRRTVAYIPDTDPWQAWPSSVTERLEKVDVALLDGSFFSADELPGRSLEEIRHPLMTDTIDRLRHLVAKGLDVRFTHLNHSNPVLDPESPERERLEAEGFGVLGELEEIGL